jgi:DNA/RNA endonuclease YhcR with UshA esterase domain
MKVLCTSWFLIVLLAGWLSAPLSAQTASVIPDTEAAQHVGQKATVAGTVVKVFTSKNGNTFLNFGAAYPNQTFTGWIQKDSPLAAVASLQTLEGKRMRISGTINLYRGKPEIRLTTKDQIQIEDED